MADDDQEMNLRYAGTCVRCGQDIPQGTRAIYNRAARNVRHVTCDGTIDRGVAGGSAMREYERRRAKDDARVAQQKANVQAKFGSGLVGKAVTRIAVDESPRTSTSVWAQGAVGEERVAAWLDSLAPSGIVALHDRRIPGTRANIDHIVVTPHGVWVVDAKRYTGKKVEGAGSLFGLTESSRLLIGGRNRTPLIDGVERQVQQVRDVVGPDVEVRGCLCFVDSGWTVFFADFTVRGVYVCWPKKLAKVLQHAGEARIDVEAVSRLLAARFPAA